MNDDHWKLSRKFDAMLALFDSHEPNKKQNPIQVVRTDPIYGAHLRIAKETIEELRNAVIELEVRLEVDLLEK